MKLVKFSKDWADEFNCDGFKVFTDDEWTEYVEAANAEDAVFNMMFGTNEGWGDDFQEDPKDVLKYDLETIDITDEEAATIQKLFGTNSFGIFPDIECFTAEEW